MDAGTNTQYAGVTILNTVQDINTSDRSMQSLIVAGGQRQVVMCIKIETVRFNLRTEVIRWNAGRRY
jgi:hypothetical protein